MVQGGGGGGIEKEIEKIARNRSVVKVGKI